MAHSASFRTMLIVFGMWSAVGLGMGGAWWWLQGRTRELYDASHAVESEIAMRVRERGEAKNLVKSARVYQPDFDRFAHFFVARERPVEFIEALEDTARKAGVIMFLTLDEGESKKTILTFHLTAEGVEDRVRTFLSLMELLPYGILVEEVSFERGIIDAKAASVSKIESSSRTRLTLLLKVQTL